MTCFFSCTKNAGTKIVIYTKSPTNIKLYLKSVPFFDEKEVIIDSATIDRISDTITLYIPQQKEERLFKVSIPGTKTEVIFVNDAKAINININYFDRRNTVTGSPATSSIMKFELSQKKLAKQLGKLRGPIDSLYRRHINKPLMDSLLKGYYAKLDKYQGRYALYDDTVKSPAAFVKEYNNVDFDTDFKRLKKFATSNAARFPNYKPIQEIKARALATVRIYEEEFYVGDKLPGITLPDINDKPFSTSSLKGQYYLIDFWSTWCEQCMPFKIEEKKIFDKGNSKIKIISVAIDDQKDTWKSIINRNKLNWVQLIDEQMWQGPAVNTLVFDSIPFNFLVSPQGKIIKKAIKPDSLAIILSKLK